MALLSQESANVAAIFFQQRVRTVFRVSLKMDEQAIPFLLDEEIYARGGGLVENVVTVRNERVRENFIPPRMREPHHSRETDRKFVLANSLVVKNAELFVR